MVYNPDPTNGAGITNYPLKCFSTKRENPIRCLRIHPPK